MTRIRFTSNLRRHVPFDGDVEVDGVDTVGQALEACFRELPKMRGYVLDEGGSLRHHMMLMVDGRHLGDRRTLSDAVTANSVIDVVQALSGG